MFLLEHGPPAATRCRTIGTWFLARLHQKPLPSQAHVSGQSRTVCVRRAPTLDALKLAKRRALGVRSEFVLERVALDYRLPVPVGAG